MNNCLNICVNKKSVSVCDGFNLFTHFEFIFNNFVLHFRDSEDCDGEFQSLDSCLSEKSTPSDNSLTGNFSNSVI